MVNDMRRPRLGWRQVSIIGEERYGRFKSIRKHTHFVHLRLALRGCGRRR
jgi:hypothetical protein